MKNHKRITLILLLSFFVGLSVLLYPTIANFWNSKTQSRLVTDYDKIISDIKGEDYRSYFDTARQYNSDLADLDFPLAQYEQISGYDDVLNVDGRGMIGYITIDKIQVRLPIYHGVSSDVLNFACGHIEGTSFPVSGESTHCVLSAHRGLPNAKLFTNLDKLELGDTFKIKVVDREYTYQVDQIKTVTPEDTNDIGITEGKEYCTLLTCTPYGINTHRLLVRGVRTETVVNKNIYVSSDAFRVDTFIVTSSVALPILLILIIYVIVKPAKKKLPVDDDEDSSDLDL